MDKSKRNREVHNILGEIKNNQPISEVANKLLNPFNSSEELKEFSRVINHGRGINVLFNTFGNGSSIQLDLVRRFLNKHFNLLTFSENVDGNTLSINALDYRLPFASVSESSVETIFSITYLKVLNSISVSDEQRKCLRDSMIIERNAPLMVGSLVPKELSRFLFQENKFGEDFNYLFVESNKVRKYFFSSQSQKIIEIEDVLEIPPLSLRFLYSIGDFAVVPENHNVIEPVHLNLPTITTPTLKKDNPNLSIYTSLLDLKAVLPIHNFVFQGFSWRPKNTMKNMGFYDFVYSSVDRSSHTWEMSPRESMKKLCTFFEERAVSE